MPFDGAMLVIDVLRNTDPGLTNPMIDTFDLAEGNLGAKYGVRLLGSFTLVIELQSEELISKPLTIGRASEKPEDAPPDNEAVWLTPYSLHQERERLPPARHVVTVRPWLQRPRPHSAVRDP